MYPLLKICKNFNIRYNIASRLWLQLFFFFILSTIPYHSYEQQDKQFKKTFLKAEGYFFYEDDYKLAIPLYLQLLKMDPENANINFKLGVCYLETPGNKEDAISCLEKSIKNTSIEYEEENYKERSAPVNAYFFLAQAYQVSNRLDEAISTYEEFISLLDVKEHYEIDFVKMQIDACKRAKVYQNYSLDIKAVKLSKTINAHNENQNPVVSGDGKVMVYTANVNDENRIYMTTFENNRWTEPIEISDQLESEGDCISSSLSYDGKTLILYKSDDKVGNLYISYYYYGSWSKIEKIKGINTKYWEANACISPDSKVLYFVSNRKGGVGGLDIYKTELKSDGQWGVPENLGPTINSPYHENYPQIIDDGKTLYFSSLGHSTIGGYDIFYSSLTSEGTWTEPNNIGYPVNTTDDNIYYMPISDGSEAYYAKYPDFEVGKLEIYHYTLLSGAPLSKIEISGDVLLEDNMPINSGIIITVLDSSFTNVIDVISPDPITGKFALSVPAGTVKLKFSAEGYEPETKIISIQSNSSIGNVELKSNLKSSEVVGGEYIVIRNIYFDFNSFHLNMEAKTELERLISILNKHTTLNFELVGHTDSKGSIKYNLSLSENRAKSVADYMINNGIDSHRLRTKAQGESQQVAININPDGTDNPEGRRYNRRVRINILNSDSQLNLKNEIFIPEHLKLKGSTRYDILVKFEEQELPLNHFTNYGINELEKIYEIEVFNGFIYAIPGYADYEEALNKVASLKQAGLEYATLLSRQQVNNLSREGDIILPSKFNDEYKYVIFPLYTIQIAASKVNLDHTKFTNLKDIRETKGKNDYFRYSVGTFNGYKNAKAALIELQQKGYPNAFIKKVKDLEK